MPIRPRNSVKFSIVMTVHETWFHLPRALSAVLQQTCPDWELILVSDGAVESSEYAPVKLFQQIRRHHPHADLQFLEIEPAPGCFGNRARHRGMHQAKGDYICWVNHDNLIHPDYLETHLLNFVQSPYCLSVVDIELWKDHVYRGRFPQSLRRSRIDLLNIALPLKTALEIDAFGPACERIYAADWSLFQAASEKLEVEWTHKIVGTHF